MVQQYYQSLWDTGKTGKVNIDTPMLPRLMARYEAAQQRRRDREVTAPTILWNEATLEAWNADMFHNTLTEIRAAVAQSAPSIGPLAVDVWPAGEPSADT